MLKSLHIEKFRCFDTFEMSGLGRVNLLTGYNNGGKTTVLEAVEALLGFGRMDWLFQTARRRGEVGATERPNGIGSYSVLHFFHGRNPQPGSCFGVYGEYKTQKIRFNSKLQAPDQGVLLTASQIGEDQSVSVQAIEVSWNFESISRSIKLPVLDGSVIAFKQLPYRDELPKFNVRFLNTTSFTPSNLVSWFDQIVLTPDEDLLLEALHLIDDRIRKIAVVAAPTGPSSLRGFLIRYEGTQFPVPLGNLGDGVSRMLCIALGLATSSGGILLIDEIDTGLHYTTLEKMWRFVYEAAKRLNVQVFATTHSGDCIKSLAAVAEEVKDDGPEAITIQHIDCEKKKAVGFDRRGVVVVAEREIEVR